MSFVLDCIYPRLLLNFSVYCSFSHATYMYDIGIYLIDKSVASVHTLYMYFFCKPTLQVGHCSVPGCKSYVLVLFLLFSSGLPCLLTLLCFSDSF